MLSDRYLPDLARVFSPPAFRELATQGQIDRLSYILRESGCSYSTISHLTLSELLTFLYKQLVESHRLEYVYKNAVTTKWLLGKHSLNTCTLLSEFEVAGAKADIVLLNSNAHALEIKTSLDDVSRLEDQVSAYRKLFGYISVITSPSTVSSVTEAVDADIGVYILSDSYTLREFRSATANYDALQSSEVVASLRKQEYSEIIRTLTGQVPDVPNALFYGCCRDLIGNLNTLQVHQEAFRVLKARKPAEHVCETLNRIPPALKALWLTAKLKVSEMEQVLLQLEQPYRFRAS